MSEIRKITINDAEYPALLREIHNPPAQLYVRGDLTIDGMGFGVVGSRVPSPYGRQVTPRLSEPLARAGLIIVSGLAMGIDGLAHESALKEGGKTIAVLGGGVDDKSVYPSAHKNLAKRIVENGGAVISEYPPGTQPLRHHFPERNRIIVGLSKGILVVEAKQKSGALITARLASEENRDVFAVPGPITSEYSWGPNRFLQLGAKPVLDARDILEEYGMDTHNTSTEEANLSHEEKTVITIIKNAPLHIDEIITQSSMSSSDLNALLVMMEIRGLIKNLGSGIYGIA